MKNEINVRLALHYLSRLQVGEPLSQNQLMAIVELKRIVEEVAVVFKISTFLTEKELEVVPKS
jgi:hypothetical protein